MPRRRPSCKAFLLGGTGTDWVGKSSAGAWKHVGDLVPFRRIKIRSRQRRNSAVRIRRSFLLASVVEQRNHQFIVFLDAFICRAIAARRRGRHCVILSRLIWSRSRCQLHSPTLSLSLSTLAINHAIHFPNLSLYAQRKTRRLFLICKYYSLLFLFPSTWY